MDFKDILDIWESSSEGKEAVGDSRLSRHIEEKEAFYDTLYETKPKGYRTGRASLGVLKRKKDEAVLDLHGYTIEESKLLIQQFLYACIEDELHKVRIVHGRGLHSKDGVGVLKHLVLEELKKSRYVRGYGNAPPEQGGSGATYVILQRG